MARLYVAINGDDVGSKIGDAIASNDHMALQEVSGAIKDSHSMIEEWVTSKGGQVVSSSGDEGLYICPEECLQELDQVRKKYSDMCGHTITVGVGNSMADASKAMIYGKLNNKNQVVHYEPMIDDYLSDDQVDTAEEVGVETQQDPAMADQGMDQQGQSPVTEGQQKQVLNEDQISAGPSNEPTMEDPNDNMESPENEVGETRDELQDDNSVDEYEKTSPEAAIDDVVRQEENKDIAEEKGMDPMTEEQTDSIEGELDDMDADDIEHDEEAGNEAEDELVGMVRQDMDDAVGSEDPEMMSEEDALAEDSGVEMPEEGMEEEGFEGEEMPEEMPMPEEGMEEEMPEDDGHNDIKAGVMDCLQIFKEHKQDLDMLSTQNPELHEAMILMLQHMIEMGRRLSEGGDVDHADELNEMTQEFPEADSDYEEGMEEGMEEEMPEEGFEDEEIPEEGMEEEEGMDEDFEGEEESEDEEIPEEEESEEEPEEEENLEKK